MSWIVPELPRLKRELAHLTLHLYFGSGEDLLRRVRTRDIDCAVTSARLTETVFASETLAEEHYVLVGAPKLLKTKPFLRPEHAGRHTLLDIDTTVPLFRYLADLHGGVGRFRFAAHRWLGLGSAIRQLALDGEGVAVLPLHMVAEDLAARRLRRILPKAKLASDQFRLVFRRDDPRADVFRALAEALRAAPIR
jgi:DNA-binding transcriptional LysR family regulator